MNCIKFTHRNLRMENLKIITNPAVEIVFKNYPPKVRKKIEQLRKLIIGVAEDLEHINQIEETLKWGEPSYLVKKGSTLRMDWKAKNPNQYAMYFQCTSQLVPTFQMVFGKMFTYEGKRAIIFQMNEKIPVAELKKCIQTTLTYHKVKHLPMLGL